MNLFHSWRWQTSNFTCWTSGNCQPKALRISLEEFYEPGRFWLEFAIKHAKSKFAYSWFFFKPLTITGKEMESKITLLLGFNWDPYFCVTVSVCNKQAFLPGLRWEQQFGGGGGLNLWLLWVQMKHWCLIYILFSWYVVIRLYLRFVCTSVS